jgi:hypothetical protein
MAEELLFSVDGASAVPARPMEANVPRTARRHGSHIEV